MGFPRTGNKLIRDKKLASLLINKGFAAHITNIKQDKFCKTCKDHDCHHCDICVRYNGITHTGFDVTEEMADVIEEYYQKENDKKEKDNEYN